MKILLDENVDNRIKDFLISKDFEVKTTYEEDLAAAMDRELLKFASGNNRIIITHDDDFLTLVEDRDEHPTIIFLPQRIRFREMKRRLDNLEDIGAENQIIYP